MTARRIRLGQVSGFSMIEVLVSLVILSIALLGTAGLMSASLRGTHTAYYRSQATVLADDILDRMRANRTATLAGEYEIDPGPVCSGTSGSMAEYDCEEWSASLADVLPSGDGRVELVSATTGMVRITIRWDGEEYVTRSRL